jgi:predicted neutral ceramidase superfamily lipid hydrolase
MGEIVAYRVEIGAREAFIAILFMIFAVIVLAIAHAGLFNPVLVGAVMTIMVFLILIGHWMVKQGVISKAALPMWYVFVLGLVLLFYGAAMRGAIPLLISSGTLQEAALITALIYTFVLVGILAVFGVLYVLTRKGIVKLS